MAFDPDAYLSGGTATDTFDPDAYLASKPTPQLPAQVVTPEDGTLSDRINKFLFSPEGAQTTREAIQGAVESIPHMAVDTAKMGYKGLRMAMGGPEERVKILTEDVIPSALSQGQQTAEDIQAPFGTPEFLRGAGQLGMMAAPGLELFRELRAPVDIPREIPSTEAPPVQVEPTRSIGPGTIADDVRQALAHRDFTLVPEPKPELAPAPTIEETLARTEQPPVPTPLTEADRTRQILDKRREKLARAAVLRPMAEQARQLIPGGERGIEAELAEIDAWLKNPIENPVVHAPPETGRTGVVAETARAPVTEPIAPVTPPEKVQHGEFAKPGYTALPTEPAAPSVTIPPEDAAYAGQQPQAVPEGVGISQARTEAELGPGSVEPGIGAELGSGLNYGRDYVNKGGDPRLPIRRANTSGMVGAKDVGIVHAELERLRAERSKAAAALEASPGDPVLQQNFSVADDAQRAWRKELQPVLTKASDALREANAQSMPDADPSTYQGLADLMDEHFKGEREVTPEMRTAMAKAAKGVKDVRDIANGEMRAVEEKLEKQVRAKGRKVMTPAELDADLKNELETQFSDCILGA